MRIMGGTGGNGTEIYYYIIFITNILSFIIQLLAGNIGRGGSFGAPPINFLIIFFGRRYPIHKKYSTL